MRVAAIIPSRYGSTRFAGKPLASIAGVPMIQRVYEQTKQALCVTDIAVATDDRRIAEAVARFGGNPLMTSESCRSGTDRAAEAAAQLGLAPEDIVVNIQGDQPLIAPQTIDETVAPLLSDPDLGMTTAAFAIVDKREITNPKDVKMVFDANGFALYFSRSPIPFARDKGTRFDTFKHLGIYAYTRRFLDIFTQLPNGVLEDIEKLEQLRALEHGHRIKVVITRHDSPEVDIPEDIPRIEALMASPAA
ncbi:MAG: 3-deoxy-manno-octulosonate cytidylyltransferase [Thermodesulfobacteriota bacterium]